MIWRRGRYLEDAETTARMLVGAVLVRKTTEGEMAVVITETEAYGGSFRGVPDDSCHAFKGCTPRTEVMFGPGGYAYVYLIYGMYCCLNLVTGAEGIPGGVLIRAGMPLAGLKLIKKNRPGIQGYALTAGPGRLCRALQMDRSFNKYDMTAGRDIYIEDSLQKNPPQIDVSTRIHVDYAPLSHSFPWRFTLRDCPWISKG